MDYYLIDLENVGNRGLEGADLLDRNSEIVVFYSSVTNKISPAASDRIMMGKASVRTQAVNVHTKNALDFELAVYVGRLVVAETTENIFIISNDGGYQAVVEGGSRAEFYNIYLYDSILEAYYMKTRTEEEKNKQNIPVKDLKKMIKRKKALYVMADVLSIDPAELVFVIMSADDNARSVYTGMLHAFGKEKGLEVYRYYRKNWVGQLQQPVFAITDQ